jgi:hypothetical protein
MAARPSDFLQRLDAAPLTKSRPVYALGCRARSTGRRFRFRERIDLEGDNSVDIAAIDAAASAGGAPGTIAARHRDFDPQLSVQGDAVI